MTGGILEQLLARIAELEKQVAELQAQRPAAADLVTVEAFARARSMGQSTVRRAIADGRLPAKRIGRSVRIPAGAEVMPPAPKATPDTVADRVLRAVHGGRS